MYLNFSEVSVDYILIDDGSQWYTWAQPVQFGTRIPLCNYVLDAIESRTYGIYASATYAYYPEEKSIALLKKGYSGKPIIGESIILDPYSRNFNFETLRLGNGSVVQDASSSSGFVMSSGVDNSGVLSFGPYIDLNPGLYEVTYVVKVDDDVSSIEPSDLLLTVDVTHSSGQVMISNKHVYGLNFSSNGLYHSGQWFNLKLTFGLQEPQQAVEFRGWGVDGRSVSLDKIVMKRISRQPSSISEFAFNFDAMDVDAGDVTDGVLVHYPGPYSDGSWFASYAFLTKGDYTARFWLKLDESCEGHILDLEVASNTNYKKPVYGSNFMETDKWQSFDVPFNLSSDADVKFSGTNVTSIVPVSLLFIEVFTNRGELSS